MPSLTVMLMPKSQPRNRDKPVTFLAHFRFGGFYFQEAGLHRFSFLIGDLLLGDVVLEAVVEPSQ